MSEIDTGNIAIEQVDLRTEFFERLAKLSHGERVALKRESGTMLAEADTRALRAFYICLPRQITTHEDRWFAVACFSCLYDNVSNADALPMQKILRSMKDRKQMSGSLGSRVRALLETEWRSDGYLLKKLNRLIQMMKRLGYRVNCDELLQDLEKWNWERHPVKQKWIQAMYSTPYEKTGKQKETEEDAD